ncbi:MAG: DUF1345 domain-containing protein [Gordonia sp. (in: high G+C Gram-positive bacteria)]
MTTALHFLRNISAMGRLGGSVVIGLLGTLALVSTTDLDFRMLPWALSAGAFVIWTWTSLAPMDSGQTAAHASREDPTHRVTLLVVVCAALASLTGVMLVLFDAHRDSLVVTTLISIIVSWAAIHTVFATHYARLYFTDPVGGVDFHQSEPPVYTDFAYVAFTVGMSYAISDTDLAGSHMRRPALAHALLAYLFGTVIVGLFINMLAGLH